MPRAGHESGMRFGLNAYSLTSSLHGLTTYQSGEQSLCTLTPHECTTRCSSSAFPHSHNIFCLMGHHIRVGVYSITWPHALHSEPLPLSTCPSFTLLLPPTQSSNIPTSVFSSSTLSIRLYFTIARLATTTLLNDRKHAFSPCSQATATEATEEAGAPQGSWPHP